MALLRANSLRNWMPRRVHALGRSGLRLDIKGQLVGENKGIGSEASHRCGDGGIGGRPDRSLVVERHLDPPVGRAVLRRGETQTGEP